MASHQRGKMATNLCGSIAPWAAMLFLLAATDAPAIEPWADPRLNPPDGLVVWLDASAYPRSREAAKGKALDKGNPDASGGPLRSWWDASGFDHWPVQEDPAQRPTLMMIESDPPGQSGNDHWVVRFDGENDHLRVDHLIRTHAEVTLFIVAAPHSNVGGFRGFFSSNQQNSRDYETGIAVDMNSGATAELSNVNVEGRGFGGARNLLDRKIPFGQLVTIEANASTERKQVSLVVDGQPAGHRDYTPGEISFQEFTLGARYHNGGGGNHRAQGFLHGDIAEVLLFHRTLTEAETLAVRKYLNEKYASLKQALPRERALAAARTNAVPLVEVKDPPPVQVLIPGFSVRELPTELRNMNNLRYRADGKLYALGYDGDVWLLSDTNGDGLEETSTRFFENKGRLRGPIGMQVIPAGHPLLAGDASAGSLTPSPSPKGRGEQAVQKSRGVVVASKGKVSALLDMDGDDIAEVERAIATGWKEIPQNVDAIGVAFDPKDGAIYFGLGTAAYNNAYQVDDQGKSEFDLKSDRGTVQRLDAKTLERTTVCTGVRFSIGMEFNAVGDLFVSEQEGATWLPNGNPFDELLHIRPGQHYGFPPRHPKHLPNVFDEPSEFDYGPQHQSTCGMCFNLPQVPDGSTFGPPEWKGDLFVTGESRGKLYRTRIVKDRSGRYVADNQLIACLSMLTVDCCLTPKGDLLIACHSGGPDWGTGPTGTGKIFRVSYDQPELPRPTGVWLAGPQELHIQFSSPLDPQHLKNLAEETKITYGEYVAAGDRFETLHPGYAAVQRQTAAPRFNLPVYAVNVTPDRKELILATAPHHRAVGYAIQLPGLGRGIGFQPVSDSKDKDSPDRQAGSLSHGTLPQHAAVDLAYTLNGVQADWHSLRSEVLEGWQRPLPHLDVSLAEPLKWPTEMYPPESGALSLRTRIDLRGLFRPVTQPGSPLDYQLETDQFIKSRSIVFRSKYNLRIVAGEDEQPFDGEKRTPGFLQVRVPILSETTESLRVHIPRLVDREFPSDLEVEWHVELADGTTRSGPIALRRFYLPWAQLTPALKSEAVDTIPPELADASWGRGYRIFHSEEAACAKCHIAAADGRRIGPDLANLRHRDLASVRRDITQPSFAINPDYLGYTVALKDGRVLTGILHNDGEQLIIGDKDGKSVRIARSEVEVLQPSTVSVMPEGLPQKLGPEKMNDLLAYLLLAPPRMPSDAKEQAPPPRSRAEVAAVLAGSSPLPTPLKPLNILLVAGAKDHGPGEHDYPAWLREWSKLLEAADGVTVSTAMEWPTAEQIQAADTIAFFQRGSWNAERARAIDAHLKMGGGLVYIHWAVEGGAEAPAFAQRIGLASDASKIKYRHGPLDLGFETGSKHPIGRNFDKLHLHDESYWLLPGDASRINVLASGEEEGASRPLFWTLEPSGGRVFVSIPGHYSWTFDDPLFRVLLLRGIAWSANEPVDRFNALVTVGVTPGE